MRFLGGLDDALELLSWGLVVLVLVLFFAGPSLIGFDGDPAQPAAGATPSRSPAPAAAPGAEAAPAPAVDGATVFAANCGSCHTLARAGTTGAIGPDLDEAAPDAARVRQVVTDGSGAMPAFAGSLSPEEIAAVAAFVTGG